MVGARIGVGVGVGDCIVYICDWHLGFQVGLVLMEPKVPGRQSGLLARLLSHDRANYTNNGENFKSALRREGVGRIELHRDLQSFRGFD